MELGEKILSLRKSQNMTQSELGAKLNVTFQAVSKWERGESYPDFETLSKVAKIFGVSISYFENNDHDESDDVEANDINNTVAATSVDEECGKKIVGFCKECGKIVYEHEEASTTPVIVCKRCASRKEAERLAQKQRAAEAVNRERMAKLARTQKIRNRGLICSAVICGALLILLIVLSTQSDSPSNYGICIAFLAVFGYTFVAQLFWDGIVVEVCLFGGKIVGMPGVIFSLDMDGVIFLIAAKIFFAVIKLFIFAITLLLAAFCASIISPFTFVPQLKKLNRGEML